VNFNQLAAKLRRDLATVPGFTVIEPGDLERRRTIRCGECDKVIRQGGTGIKLELCGTCSTNLEA
jgi:hypothetical protein